MPGVAAGQQTVAPKLLPGPWGEGSTHQQQLQKQFLRENRLPVFRHSFKVGAEETLISFPLAQTSTIALSSGVIIFCNWASLQHVQSKDKKHLWLNIQRC